MNRSVREERRSLKVSRSSASSRIAYTGELRLSGYPSQGPQGTSHGWFAHGSFRRSRQEYHQIVSADPAKQRTGFLVKEITIDRAAG